MVTNKSICLVHTELNIKTKSIYDEYNKKKGGVLIIECPISGKVDRFPFKNETEKKLWKTIKRESKTEST